MRDICKHLIAGFSNVQNSTEIIRQYELFLEAIDFCREQGVAIDRDLLKPYAEKIIACLFNEKNAQYNFFIDFDQTFNYYQESDLLLHADEYMRQNFNENKNYILGDYLFEKFSDTKDTFNMILLNHLSSPHLVLSNVDGEELIRLSITHQNPLTRPLGNPLYGLEKMILNMPFDNKLYKYIKIRDNLSLMENRNDDFFLHISQEFIKKLDILAQKHSLDKSIASSNKTSINKL